MGGGTSLETLSRLAVLEKELSDLKQTIASDATYGLAKITNATDVTQESGIALSAVQNNAAVSGTLRNKIETLISDRNSSWKSVPITSFSPGLSAMDGVDGVHCAKKESGERMIVGVLVVSEGFSLSEQILFRVPEEFSFNADAQAWLNMTSSGNGTSVTLRMVGTAVLYWSNVLIQPGTYIFSFTY